MKWCQRCVLPDTRPGLRINEDGVCNACLNHQRKPHVDWDARRELFKEVVLRAKNMGREYDCLIPVSGGKDSTWQVLTCLEYGLRPLAVTWKTPGRTVVGRENLENLVSLGVDHVDFTISPRVERTFMWKAFCRFGSTAIPMHMALFNIPLKIAFRFGIPLVVWGENSAFEYGSEQDATQGFELDENWLRKFGVMHGTSAEDWADEDLSTEDLVAYQGPTYEQLKEAGVLAVFLGYYFEWDPVKTYQAARQVGFKNRVEGAKTGLYDFADIDDDFISVHHFMKWYKFGFTRLFDNLSLEIRNGRLKRDTALQVIRTQGEQVPSADIQKCCSFMGVGVEEFYEAAEKFRNLTIWKRKADSWSIPEFLIPDWSWS